MTPHFAADEFSQPARHGFAAVPYPTDWLQSRLLRLCQQLEVIRETAGLPVRILSGYRAAAYNRAIGGAKHSQHMQGRAADFVIPGKSPRDVHALILDLVKSDMIRIGGLGNYKTFTHIDIRPGPRFICWAGSRKDAA